MDSDRMMIYKEISALSSHYPVSTKAPDDHARWLSDFADDLGDMPVKALVAGCAEWRRTKARFPTPGALRAMCQEHVPALPRPPVRVYAPLSDAEYASATIADKIDHHLHMANQARDRAGPMWKDGRPAGPSELPARWHHWTPIAKHHEAEVSRLREIKAEHQSRDRAA